MKERPSEIKAQTRKKLCQRIYGLRIIAYVLGSLAISVAFYIIRDLKKHAFEMHKNNTDLIRKEGPALDKKFYPYDILRYIHFRMYADLTKWMVHDKIDFSDAIVLYDDVPALEHLYIKAALEWRKSSNKNYTEHLIEGNLKTFN